MFQATDLIIRPTWPLTAWNLGSFTPLGTLISLKTRQHLACSVKFAVGCGRVLLSIASFEKFGLKFCAFCHFGFFRVQIMVEPLHETFQSLERLSDLVLVSSDGVEFRVHKVFLARSSPFFRELFSTAALDGGQIQVSDTTRLQLNELEAPQLETFLNYVYSPPGTSPISLDNVKMLTEAGRKYQMQTLLSASDDFCTRKVDLVDKAVLEWLGFAYEYDLPSFTRKCEQLVERSSVRDLIGHLSEREVDALHRKVASKLLKCAASCQVILLGIYRYLSTRHASCICFSSLPGVCRNSL